MCYLEGAMFSKYKSKIRNNKYNRVTTKEEKKESNHGRSIMGVFKEKLKKNMTTDLSLSLIEDIITDLCNSDNNNNNKIT